VDMELRVGIQVVNAQREIVAGRAC